MRRSTLTHYYDSVQISLSSMAYANGGASHTILLSRCFPFMSTNQRSTSHEVKTLSFTLSMRQRRTWMREGGREVRRDQCAYWKSNTHQSYSLQFDSILGTNPRSTIPDTSTPIKKLECANTLCRNIVVSPVYLLLNDNVINKYSKHKLQYNTLSIGVKQKKGSGGLLMRVAYMVIISYSIYFIVLPYPIRGKSYS